MHVDLPENDVDNNQGNGDDDRPEDGLCHKARSPSDGMSVEP